MSQLQIKRNNPSVTKTRIEHQDGKATTVYSVRFKLDAVRPKIVDFAKPTLLLEYCENNKIQYATSAAFFSRKDNLNLGDIWIDGVKQNTIPYISPFNLTRGSFYISDTTFRIAPRNDLPNQPENLLQAGPMLIKDGESVVHNSVNPEGISTGSHQFDDDITIGRFPRVAIGITQEYIYASACDGMSEVEAGMTLKELSDYLIQLGVKEALNLDGGSSATLVAKGRLLNKPRGGENDQYQLFKRGRHVQSAIIFD